ncbi:MAG: hypothetical protein F6J97_24420 [Leptolyngbya sp. SIO4C1]|nr:hypothetical protein [Leptolyngbya sp. SIO4C1]
MLQVAISPSALLDESICVENIDGFRLFKFTKAFQSRQEALLKKNGLNTLSSDEQKELDSLNELERFFTYLNARLLAQT